MAARLLAWYDTNGRDLPWRVRPRSGAVDPYRVWLSEIMLQQTTVGTVGPYYERFLARWPDVAALAAAPLDDVLHAWAGLGYYARARNLHKCACIVAAEHGGVFPDTEAALRALPGVGAYTAAAIAAIAFDRPATVVDGNVERVMARLYAVKAPLPAAKRVLTAHAEALSPAERPGDYAQGLMDLGATVCTPKKPACGRCPWHDACDARAQGRPEQFPRKSPKAARPLRHGVVFWLARRDGAVLLRRRPEAGLLGGMIEVPGSEWRSTGWSESEALAAAPCPAAWQRLAGTVSHGFTHFELSLAVYAAQVDGRRAPRSGLWTRPEDFGERALPTLTSKVIRHVSRADALQNL